MPDLFTPEEREQMEADQSALHEIDLMEEWFAKHNIATISGKTYDGKFFSFCLPTQGKR